MEHDPLVIVINNPVASIVHNSNSIEENAIRLAEEVKALDEPMLIPHKDSIPQNDLHDPWK